MKNFKDTIRTFTALLLLAAVTVATGCSKDDNNQGPVVSEGVVFEFAMRKVYSVSAMTEIASVKITLEQNGTQFTLPSLTLSGSEQLVSTSAYHLAPGSYTFVSYIAYNSFSDQLFKAEIDKDNLIEVKANTLTTYALPIDVRIVAFPDDYYRNALYGLCVELFGEDNEDAWPWDFEKRDLRDMQKNNRAVQYLEFEEDDADNILYLSGINISGADFASVTEFPARTLANLKTMGSLTLSDLPNLKKIKDIESLTNLDVLTVYNTALEEVPAEIGQCQHLTHLTLVKNQIKTLPEAISTLKDLRILSLRGNQIERFDLSLTAAKNLETVNLSENPLTSIGENVFAADQKLIRLIFSHTQISTLPAAIGRMELLRGIELTNCQFTSVPDALKNNTNLKGVWLAGNPLSDVAPSAFNGMSNLDMLDLSNIAFKTTPTLNLPLLLMLQMNNCALETAPDFSKLPKLLQLELKGNKIATGTLDFTTNNPALRILSFSDSDVATLPTINVAMKDGKVAAFGYLEVRNCKNLQMTTPAAWNCYDLYLGDITGQEDGQNIYESFFGPADGRVGVDRVGSPGVAFGK